MATSSTTDPFSHIVSRNPRMRDVIAKARKFALLDAPLVIQGETGTGRDVIVIKMVNLSVFLNMPMAARCY